MAETNTYLIVIAIVGLILSILLSIFFSYLPMARIEDRFDTTADSVDAALIKIEKIADDIEKAAVVIEDTLARLNRLEAAICTDQPGLLPSFCV